MNFGWKLSAFCLFLGMLCAEIFGASAAAETDELPPSIVKAVAHDFGSCVADREALKSIANKFPQHAARARTAGEQFDAQFSPSMTNMADVLRPVAGVVESIRQKWTTKEPSENEALQVIATMEMLAKGEHPSPALKTLLTFHPKYIKQPELEWKDGFKERFISGPYGQKGKIKVEIGYPRSWESEERPGDSHFLRTLGNPLRRAREVVLIGIKPLAEVLGTPNTEEDVEQMIALLMTPAETKRTLPANATLIRSERVKLGGRPGFCQQFTVKRGEKEKFATANLVYAVYCTNLVVQIHCLVAVEEKRADELNAQFVKFAPLFSLMANSLTFSEAKDTDAAKQP